MTPDEARMVQTLLHVVAGERVDPHTAQAAARHLADLSAPLITGPALWSSDLDDR